MSAQADTVLTSLCAISQKQEQGQQEQQEQQQEKQQQEHEQQEQEQDQPVYVQTEEDATATATATDTDTGADTGAEKEGDKVEVDRRLCVYWHPACYEHSIPDHPEQPDRVKVMLEHLRRALSADTFRLAPLVQEDQVLLFHTRNHFLNFQVKADKVEKKWAVGQGKLSYSAYDSDTAVMHATREACFRAAGSVCAAVDSVFAAQGDAQYARSAFCCVRPPGHHAERNTVMGFCFFNGAGIAAKYAQQRYGGSHGVKKVAVMDFDVHHGNGTEEGFLRDESCFYGSTHEQDNFPGTGVDLYPNIGDNAKSEQHRRIVNRYLTGGDHQKSRREFKPRWRHVVDEMERFQPDLVVFSAGFDAHGADPLGNCWLTDEDFAWATDIVLAACARIGTKTDKDTPVPCVSVLEGGYDLEAIARSAVLHCESLQRGHVEPAAQAVGDEAAALADTIAQLEF